MTCEDCVHYDLCVCVGTRKLYPGSSEGCRFFADKNRFVKLPCNPGDTVYILQPCIKRNAKSYQEFIDSFNLDYELQIVERNADKALIGYLIGYPYFNSYILGKTVFLAREEAEAALAKMNRKDDT